MTVSLPRIRLGLRLRSLLVVIALLIPACASMRHYELVGSEVQLENQGSLYVVVNAASEKVVYDYLLAALAPPLAAADYDKYAKGRVPADAKLDVPLEIVRYLRKKGKDADLGPPNLAPGDNATIIAYEELWGWDMRPILKSLKIRAFRAGQPAEGATVSFEEMTVFNSQPVASSLVPAMMDVLFGSAEREP